MGVDMAGVGGSASKLSRFGPCQYYLEPSKNILLAGLLAGLLLIFISIVLFVANRPSAITPYNHIFFKNGKMQPDSALQIPNEATLLQEDTALVVRLASRPSRTCSSFWSQDPAVERIFYQNILTARVDSNDILILTYAKPKSKTKVRLATQEFNKSRKVERSVLEQWASDLEAKAWDHGRIQRNKRIKVLINPVGGTGHSRELWLQDIKPILEAAGCTIHEEYTTHKGHAVDIARDISVMDYDVIACCSGDGLPHEVFNGLGKRDDARLALAKLAVVQLPCGSGNGMCWNCFGTISPTLAALRFAKSVRMPLDLVSLTQLDPVSDKVTRTLSFLSQAVGIIADIDLGTENMRWLGATRFDLGFLMRIMTKVIYPCDIAVATSYESKEDVRKFHAAELAKEGDSDSERLASVLKEYQLREQEPSHVDDIGLPKLRYGTVTDPLPDGWQQTPFDNLGNFYCGNMTIMSADVAFFPGALPDDGHCDLVTIPGDISRLKSIEIAQNVPQYKFFDMPEVRYRKVTGYRIRPKAKSGYISIDGESIRHAEFQAEVHKALGTTMSLSGRKYEAKDIQLRSTN